VCEFDRRMRPESEFGPLAHLFFQRKNWLLVFQRKNWLLG
jgi:hypothetical protein